MACFHPNQLPSPRGDELFQEELEYNHATGKLPSPRGDELFQAQGGQAKGEQGYRPLAGMNCFERIKNFSLVLLRYRPLAGMNCFYHLQYIKWRKEVSVPSLG